CFDSMWPLSISIVLQTRYGILVNKSTFRVEARAILPHQAFQFRHDKQKPLLYFADTAASFVCAKGFAVHVMISLSVPIYNEEGSIEQLFEKVRVVMNRHGDPWEIIFVNDGSLDRSEEILNGLATAHREVKVIHFRRNFGQTAAMMAGFDFAS